MALLDMLGICEFCGNGTCREVSTDLALGSLKVVGDKIKICP